MSLTRVERKLDALHRGRGPRLFRGRWRRRFLYWLGGHLPCRVIPLADGREYLERYYLCTLFNHPIYLHRFVNSRDERHFHNHPYKRGISLILVGAYVENRLLSSPKLVPVAFWRIRVRWFSAGMVNYIGDGAVHRLCGGERDTWTLFAHAEKDRRWGFFVEDDDDYGIATFVPAKFTPDGWWVGESKGKHKHRAPVSF